METELTVKYILNQMRYLGVIEIWIDDERIWSDNIDCTGLTTAEEAAAITANNKQYMRTIAREDFVTKYVVEIVHYHHTIIKFYTINYNKELN